MFCNNDLVSQDIHPHDFVQQINFRIFFSTNKLFHQIEKKMR